MFRNKSFLAERTYFLGSISQREIVKCRFWSKTISFMARFVVHLAFYARLGSPKVTISLIII